jgi:hypothetical protein
MHGDIKVVCTVRLRLKRSEAKIMAKIDSLRSEKNGFSHVSLRSKALEIISETKANQTKKAKQSKAKRMGPKNREIKLKTARNLIDLNLLDRRGSETNQKNGSET